MKILVTGANGFVAKNLRARLAEMPEIEVSCCTRDTKLVALREAVSAADFIFHLAGANRPERTEQFEEDNYSLTRLIAKLNENSRSPAPLMYASSLQVESNDSEYARSKLLAENELTMHANTAQIPVYIYRLTNIFGKWSRPAYNSVVATFCHNLAYDKPIQVHNPSAKVDLLYIDDLIAELIEILQRFSSDAQGVHYGRVSPVYSTTVGELAEKLSSIAGAVASTDAPRAGGGFERALWATYLSFLSEDKFYYRIKSNADERGAFSELLKTPLHGQVSYFTAVPGMTRGRHYHHTKWEKFLVVSGTARFRFRNLDTNESFERVMTREDSEVIQSIPGWAHEVANVGDDLLIVLLWANEVFDERAPDTYAVPAEKIW